MLKFQRYTTFLRVHTKLLSVSVDGSKGSVSISDKKSATVTFTSAKLKLQKLLGRMQPAPRSKQRKRLD